MALGDPGQDAARLGDADELDRLVESYLRKGRRYKAELRRLD